MFLLQKRQWLKNRTNNYNQISKEYYHVRKLLLKILWLYQKFFTLLGYGSCRYYPTCSEYARINFEKNPLLTAFYNSFTRILRCNQLFDGGIDYPVLQHFTCKAAKLDINSVKYWLVPNQKNRCYIIKNFSYKG
ncbi:MAG: membrane protein insertion efficiency factor YidD [Epsilonproteobacteria bacterium]|nr:membrane protein insertion efficiency factor YidD [Campylobacterota bacterium]